MPTSQLETHPFSFRSPPHLRCIARPLPPPPQPPSPYIPFPYCLQHGHSCHCIEKYHAPINHLQHRTLYQRTIRERWEGGRVHRSGILATGTSVEGWSRVSGVGRWPDSVVARDRKPTFDYFIYGTKNLTPSQESYLVQFFVGRNLRVEGKGREGKGKGERIE